MPALEASSFLVNLSPISVINDVKQKNVSASACAKNKREKNLAIKKLIDMQKLSHI